MKRNVEEARLGSSQPAKRYKLAGLSIFEKLSEELCFNCLSHLDYADLLSISESSKYLNRLADDNYLWKALYAQHYVDQTQRSVWLHDKNELPTRTWKQLFRIAHNWKVGRARATRLSLRSSVLPAVPLSTELDDQDDAAEQPTTIPSSSSANTKKGAARQPAKVVWHGQNYFVPGHESQDGGLPSVDVFRMTVTSEDAVKVASIVSQGLKGKDTAGSLFITEIQLDAAADVGSNDIRLAVFYSNGQFSIFGLQNIGTTHEGEFVVTEEFFSGQTSSRPTVMASLHYPILVTCNSDCSVRFRFLEHRQDKQSGQIRIHVSMSPPTMRTSFFFAPMTMRLVRRDHQNNARGKAQSTPQQFQLSLAYSTPYYPSAFTVGMQVYNISIPTSSSTSTNGLRRSPLEVFVRSAIAAPPAMDAAHSDQHNSTIVNTIEHDGPYIVASRSDNTISVYRVLDGLTDSWLSDENDAPPSPAKMHAMPLKLRHVRTLFGHTAAVDAVSVLDGRCVSTGKDGIKVWDLPRSGPADLHSGTGDYVNDELSWQPNTSVSERGTLDSGSKELHVSKQAKCGWIGLDTSRIVTISEDENGHKDRLIKVYHFE